MGQTLVKSGKPRFIDVNGLLLPYSFTRDNVLFATMLRPDDGDIVIAGYPNSGTKTVAIMLHLLLHPQRKAGNQVSIDVPLIEWVGPGVNYMRRPRIMCTHLPYSKLNINPMAKYVYTIRNPKDCCAHGFEDAISFPQDYAYPEGCFDDYLGLFLQGAVHGNDYFNHVLSWWGHPNDSHVLKLVFEHLRIESRPHMERVVGFVGWESMVGRCKSAALMQEVLENIASGPAHTRIMDIKMATPTTDRPVANVSAVAYWKNYFTCGQSKMMDSVFLERTRESDIRNLWNDYNVFAF
ncbi:sulfotransferase ssu-1-like [Ixodes scapularis]|uniref:sulfotransferase ssu-1-like n=1 Tax=Ixodes scapularis TaxID=6945 RepID=UPI001C39356C|nr:sulfotransferase ssu-1-like [Ixodes scapularis]